MSPIYVKDAGVWKLADPYVKDAGTWKLAQGYVKDAGVWKQASTIDTTPPPAPTMLLTVMENRYIKVSIRVGGSNEADVDIVRVLAGGSAQEYPGTPYSSGYITEADTDYPNETWSDWKYNTSVRGNSAVYTTKEFPQNPSTYVKLTGDRYYYFSCWSRDFAGNWSAPSLGRVWMGAIPTLPGTETPVDQPARTNYIYNHKAIWSRAWLPNNQIFTDGRSLKVGPWKNHIGGPGNLVACIGWDSAAIARDLAGATITKVELRLTSINHLSDAVNTRFRYHNLATAPASPVSVNDFGDWLPITDWVRYRTRTFDLTAASPYQWKTGEKKGIFMSFTPESISEIRKAVHFEGHQDSMAPMLRFYVTK